MTTAGTGPAPATPAKRAAAAVVLGVGVAAGAAGITLLSLIMRSVTAVGGSCADGGPYVSAQPCPSGTGTALLLVFGSAITCLIATLWGAAVLRAPLPLLLAWPALFLTLGWNFLEDGFDPPMGEDIAVGYVVCGVLFVLMGAGPLLLWLSVARDARRTRTASAAVPTPVAAARVAAGTRPLAPEPARVVPRPRQDDDPAAAAMSVAGRLERLAVLHASGELTDEEYTLAKQATLREELDP
ncbi:SHOCT domain-containing protein [Geodermatophilus sp. SYSU D00691]